MSLVTYARRLALLGLIFVATGCQGAGTKAQLEEMALISAQKDSLLREVLEIPRGEAVRTAGKTVAAEDAALLNLWLELRNRSAALARALKPEHLERTLGDGGDTVGRMLRHLAGCTAWLRLFLDGREDEDEVKLWDPSWTPDRLAQELERDRDEFSEAMGRHLPQERQKLGRMIRHEAWHQGQIAAVLRHEFEPNALWKV